MKILFCSPHFWTADRGAPKVLVELSDALAELGWTCDHVCLPELVAHHPRRHNTRPALARALRDHLRERAHEYDVIDYDHAYLPYRRRDFSQTTLFVARSVLLPHQVARARIRARSDAPLVRRTAGRVVRWWDMRRSLRFADRTIAEADLVNVSNEDDRDLLVERGVPKEKVAVLPFGLTGRARELLERVSGPTREAPVIVFIGTFDFRKGAVDFTEIIRTVTKTVPGVKIKLLGTHGLFKTETEVLRFFPESQRDAIMVIPRYEPDELCHLLKGCSVGIFPSYVEGFPFGVLEMLTASIPVIAYRAPGPPMMLSPEFLVTPGDTAAMGTKVARLLRDERQLSEAREWARRRAADFTWRDVAQRTSALYSSSARAVRAARSEGC